MTKVLRHPAAARSTHHGVFGSQRLPPCSSKLVQADAAAAAADAVASVDIRLAAVPQHPHAATSGHVCPGRRGLSTPPMEQGNGVMTTLLGQREHHQACPQPVLVFFAPGSS